MTSFKVVLPLLLLMLPALVQAQFTFTTNNGAITIIQYTGLGALVVVPSSTNGWPVTSIGINAFSKTVYPLSGVTLPDTVTNIGDFAFFGEKLTNVTLGNSLVSVGSFAFSSCTRLTRIELPNSVTSIGSSAFNNCVNLVRFAIPNGVSSVGGSSFAWCRNMTNVIVGSGVTNLEDLAFSDCAKLTAIYFRGNAPSLGGSSVFLDDNKASIYYLPGTTGWEQWVSPPPAVLWNPQPQSVAVQDNQVGFTITGSTNIPVVIEASTSLVNPTWLPLQTYTLTNGSIYFSDPQWTNYPGRFYRLRSP